MVKQKKLPIRWDILAKSHLDEIYDHIAQDSVNAARYVKKELIILAGRLNNFPEKYSREEFLIEEQDNYRSVSKWSYKIIYEVTDEYLIIADIFHTSQHPKKIKQVKDK